MPEKLPFRDMEGEDLAITVLTCEGDIEDPTFPFKLQRLVAKLQNLISDEENPIKVTKVEPWNSVRVTFNIPLEAAQRLRQLAERGDRVLRELGILSVQIEGDQVITLTLASQYSEPQEIVLRKTSDEQGDVASVSFNLPNSDPVPGPSTAEPAHKNISQFLGHIVGGATSSTANAGPSTRLEKTASPKPETSLGFRSPNVIAPSSTEPIPFPPSTVITTTAALPSSSRVSPNVSLKSPSGFGPFPFASMTHAMNTKNSASPQYQPVLHMQGGNTRLSLSSTAQLTNSILSSSSSSVVATSSKVSNSPIQKVSRTIANSAFNNVVSRAVPPNAIASTSRANVALSSPLLVNLLQSETSNLQQNNKLMPPPSQASNQAPKKKRKPRKIKDKIVEDGNVSSPNFSTSPSPPSYQSHVGAKSPGSFDHLSVLGPSLNVPINISSPNSQIANIHPMAQGQPPVSTNMKPQNPNIHSQTQGLPPVSLQSQVQGQPMVSTTRPLGHQTISAFRQTQGHRAVPNIHPQAQGQPQVHTGNLPLHTHIPVGALQVARPPTGNLQSYAMSAPRTIPINPTRSIYVSRDIPMVKSVDKTKEVATLKSDRTSASSTPSTSTPDSNPFPSPPSSSDGKTKHLVNPFTGQLEPMPSDDEEEEESIGSLPPFPDFEIDTSEKSQSERSLSDGGKDNNLSSDTDSGISKSITDVSQSSTDGLNVDSGKDAKKLDPAIRTDSVTTASVTSSVPGEKIKLRLKLDSKSIRESKESEIKEKRAKDSNPTLNQKIDVALASIPGVKKSTVSSSPSVPEPRVPPLHISLRGPNAAVVVSPRKDDSKSRYSSSKDDHPVGDVPLKVVPKKVRSPRAPRTGEVPTIALSLTGRTLESVDKKARGSNPKELKKVKDDFWNQNVKMSMSGGGIVEVSDKLSTSRVSSYDTYNISSTPISSPIVQRKSSSIFSLASRDSCKSEIMTLTSCSTGESVTLHSFVGSKSPLPLQVAAVSETEAASTSQTVKNEVSSNVTSMAMPTERTISEKVSNTDNEKSPETSSKDNSFSSSKNSPLMQNNYLPHSPSAPLDSKNDVQKSSCPSDQNQLQSASSLNVVSTVPLSSHSASSHTCNTNEAASDSNVQTQVSDSTDAKRLDVPCRVMATPVDDVTSTTDSPKLQNNHQCNTHSINNTSENVDENVNVDKNVQNELKSPHESENAEKGNPVVNEVQNAVDVNKNHTANEGDCGTISNDSVKNEISHLVTPKPSSTEDGDKFKKFSNHSDTCNLSVSCLTTVPKTEINEVVSDKNMCIVDVKNPPIAQIITVDNLPIQSHVIEVPSMQNSPTVSNLLTKSGCATEVSSLSTLVPSCGSQYLPSRNVLVVQDSSDVSVCEGRVSPMNIPLLTMPCNSDKRVKLINHVNKIMQEAPSTVKESKESQNLYPPKEEMKLDPVEEERKRCMLLSEVPTSTPGPPPSETPPSNVNSSKSDKLCSEPKHSTSSNEPIEIKTVESTASTKSITNEQSSNSTSIGEKSVTPTSLKKDITKPDSTISSDLQINLPTSSNVIVKKEITITEKINSNTPAVLVNSTQSLPTKLNQLETVSTSVLSTPSSSSSTNSVEAGPSVENKFTPKQEVKKESTCAESISMTSTTANSLVTSLLSPVKYLHNEVSSQKFKLIFKNSGQRSALPGGSSPTGLVVPLNSSKVPIKFVALPGGASALSVRSTSNPNIVEIIGPKTAQNSPSNNPHISSPVRLVVSKVSPSLACTNPGNSPNMRNRVLVKSVVVTSTSPSIKLLSANNLCTTTPISLNPGATATSTVVQSISSAVVSNSAPVLNTKFSSEDSKPATTVENSSVQTLCISSQEKITIGNNLPSSNSDSSVSLNKNSTVSNASCSSSADSTTKDSCPDSANKNVSPTPVIADSSVKLTVTPDTTSPVTVESATESITSSTNHLKKEDSSKSVSECISSEDNSKLPESECDKNPVISKKSAADTTTEHITDEVSSVTCDTEKSTDTDNKIEVSNSNISVTNTDTFERDDEKSSDKTTNNAEVSKKTSTSAESDDSETVEQTADSAITTSSKYISNDLESSDVADSSIVDQSLCSDVLEKGSKLKPNPLPINPDTSVDNCVGIGLEDPCLVENEVIIASNIEVEVSSENDETKCNQGTESSNRLSEHSVTVDSAPTIMCKDEVIETDDTDSLDAKLGVNMQKFRPLGEESVGMVDSTESEDSKVVVEDSQLEISLVYSKPVKRKCSENAAELIKACMGVEDGPKRGVLVKNKSSEDTTEKTENEKVEENVRMSLRIRRDEPLLKKAKGTTVNSDCSTDEELTLSELATKSRTRDKPSRGRISNRDSPVEPNHCKPNRRRSGSNESHHSEEIKTRSTRENKREANKKEEITKKLPERTKRGTFKAQDQVVMSKVALQRSGRIRDQELKSNALQNSKEETNSIGAKRKTRNTSDSQEMLVHVKRRRYSKDGHR